jgi:hypothetical protein
MTKIAESGSESLSQRYGSTDPDPYQNVTDPQHCLVVGFAIQYLVMAMVCIASISASH